MNAEQVVWILAFLVKLHRGEIIKDSANAADKAADEYDARYGGDGEEED